MFISSYLVLLKAEEEACLIFLYYFIVQSMDIYVRMPFSFLLQNPKPFTTKKNIAYIALCMCEFDISYS